MKIKKEQVKQGIKNQLLAILYMIIFNLITFAIFGASYLGAEPTGNVTGSGLLGMEEYKINGFLAVLCWLVFFLVFVIYYAKFWKKDFKKQKEIHWGFAVCFVIVSIVFGFVEFVVIEATSMIVIGLFSKIINYPNAVALGILLAMVGYIVLDFIREKKGK